MMQYDKHMYIQYGKRFKCITNVALVVHIHGNLVQGSLKVARISSQLD